MITHTYFRVQMFNYYFKGSALNSGLAFKTMRGK